MQQPILDYNLPQYLPLDKSLITKFEKTTRFPNALAPKIDELLNQILTSTTEYILYMLETSDNDCSEVINCNLASVETLIRNDYDLRFYKSSLDASKVAINDGITRDPQFNLENLDDFHSETRENFASLIAVDYTQNKTISGEDSIRMALLQNESYRQMKSMAFVIKNPEDPIPDEDEEDEELNVSGGKISLKDPLSLHHFRHPVYSKVCKHTFEKDSISGYLNSQNTDCPITGCSSSLSKDDLKTDVLMQLRVAAYISMERNGKRKYENVQRVV